MSKCPLGDDCDLTVAYMIGYDRGKTLTELKYRNILKQFVNDEEFDKMLSGTYNNSST